MGMSRKSVTLLVAATLSLGLFGVALTGSATAAGPALDQYVETLPDSGGDRPSNPGSNGDGSSSATGSSGSSAGTAAATSLSAPTVPSGQLSALRASGTDGGAAASAIEAISGGVASGGKGANSGAADTKRALDAASGETGIAAALGVLLAGGPGGFALPIILLTVLAGGLVVVARRRSSGSDRI